MKLFWTPASPFTRKVCVAARETGQWNDMEIVKTTWPLSWGYETVAMTPGLAEANPVARIPTLVTGEGVELGDSTVICLYLNARDGGNRLVPQGDAAWRMWSLYAIADGILEAQVGMRAEMLRPDAIRAESYLDKQRERIWRCFDRLEASAAALATETDAVPDMAAITTGIACGYQDWRVWLDDFRPGRPGLAAWYEAFAARPSMMATVPTDTPEK